MRPKKYGSLCRTEGTVRAQGECPHMPSAHEITHLLQAWSAGDNQALEKLTPLVYQELHRTARRFMALERPDHTLQATALIDEVYLRLVDCDSVSWQDRNHFFAVCARLMRRILTDFARSRQYLKRGGAVRKITFDENLFVTSEPRADLVALDHALEGLSKVDKRKSDVVELRFFGGLGVKDTASVLGVSDETVKRDWRLAKLWLLREMGAENRDGA
jgi:RNA polymerase sigma factor (TIGR02999 family)